MPVHLRVLARQPVFTAGKAVIDFQVENATTESVAVYDPAMPGAKQPTFTLRAPDGRQVRFVPADGRHLQASAPSPVVTIAPGESAEGDLELREFADVDGEGEYVLEATLEFEGTTAVAQPASFRVESMPMQDVSAFSSRSPEGEAAAGLVVLARGRQLGTAVVREQDPRNGELFPLEVRPGPEVQAVKRTLGWYANYDIAFDPARWLLAVTETGLAAGTNLSPKVASAPAGKPIDVWLNGLVVKGRALAVPAIARSGQGSELLWFSGTAQGGEPRLEPARSLTTFSGVAQAAAATLAPAEAQAVVVAAVPAGDAVQLLTWLVAGGAVRQSKEHRVDGLRAIKAAGVGWSTKGEIRVSMLGADGSGAVRMADISLGPDLNPRTSARVSPALAITDPREAALLVFEQSAGTLARAAVVRSPSGTVGINDQNEIRRPQLPAAGPFAMVSGRDRWYVLWADGTRLQSSSF
jgi:hypothetical protein